MKNQKKLKLEYLAKLMEEENREQLELMESGPKLLELKNMQSFFEHFSSAQQSNDDDPADDGEASIWFFASDKCPVCFDVNYNKSCSKMSGCQHVMCEQCLLELMKKSKTLSPCPICRTPITGYETFDHVKKTLRYTKVKLPCRRRRRRRHHRHWC